MWGIIPAAGSGARIQPLREGLALLAGEGGSGDGVSGERETAA
jgi:hypothetical protein